MPSQSESTRRIRHITVAVPDDLYVRTRRIAVNYNSTVTAIVAYLLDNLPRLIKLIRYPVGGVDAVESQTITSTPPAGLEKGENNRLESAISGSFSAVSASKRDAKNSHADRDPSKSSPSHSDSDTSSVATGQRTAPVRQYSDTGC